MEVETTIEAPAVSHGMTSATLEKLAAALSKAQGAMRGAKKDSVNPHFKSSYADLASIWDAIRAPLSENGLSVVQRVGTTSTGVSVETLLLHSSGQWVRDACWLPVQQQTAQAFGSAITYARRYSLSALVGVAAEDDDGQNASQGHRPDESKSYPPPSRGQKVTKPELSAKTATTVEVKPAPTPDPSGDALRARRLRLWKAAQDAGMTEETFGVWAARALGATKATKDWTDTDLNKLEVSMPGKLKDLPF